MDTTNLDRLRHVEAELLALQRLATAVAVRAYELHEITGEMLQHELAGPLVRHD